MIKTSDLVEALVADARPVCRLRPPTARAALWLFLAALIFALLVLSHGLRPDLWQRLEDPAFVVSTAASLLTGVLAAVAAFMLNLPDRSPAWALLPVPSLVAWVGGVGEMCLTQWVSLGPEGLQVGDTARCFATVLTTSLPLALAVFVMLRRGSVLRAGVMAFTASLAVAAMTATAMSLFHRLDASALILVWNLGSAALIVAAGSFVRLRAYAA